MRREFFRYCAGCMTESPEWPLCANPECDWDELASPINQSVLRRHTLLLGKYYVGRVLDVSGFGVTYIARDLAIGSRVTVKEFFPRNLCFRHENQNAICLYDQKPEVFTYVLERFIQEAHTLAILDHPNILSVKNLESGNGTAYMVMPYIEGCALQDIVIQSGGRISAAPTFEILNQLMDALHEVHRNGLIHRDICPENIMISRAGIVKLIGIGSIGSFLGPRTMNTSAIVRHSYSPEEQYRSGGKQGPWTDVYAVCATAYHCITGLIPPPAIDRIHKDELVLPSIFCPDLPPAREAALLKGMAVKHGERFQTIEELRDALNCSDC
jgi:serine/threonine protein kinase